MRYRSPIGIAIIGCGHAGSKRANRLKKFLELARLICICDVDNSRLQLFRETHDLHCYRMQDYRDAIDHPDVNAVFVCVPNAFHHEVTRYALKKGKHVLCEKPLAVNEHEASTIVQLAKEHDVFLKTGSNHRFLPNIIRANAIVSKGLIGEVMFLRGHIGHRRDLPLWHYDKSIAGGGAVLDNGVHLYDLARCFLKDVIECIGVTQFAGSSRDAESSGFSIFKSASGQVAMLQASWTEWNEYLLLEVAGREGHIGLTVSRDGGLEIVWRDAHGKSYHETEWEEVYDSWALDTKEFLEAITQGRQPLASGYDGLMAVKMAWGVYRSSLEGRCVHL